MEIETLIRLLNAGTATDQNFTYELRQGQVCTRIQGKPYQWREYETKTPVIDILHRVECRFESSIPFLGWPQRPGLQIWDGSQWIGVKCPDGVVPASAHDQFLANYTTEVSINA